MQTINLMGLSAYLNDHSVGSIAAVELIDEFLKRPESADEKGFFTGSARRSPRISRWCAV